MGTVRTGCRGTGHTGLAAGRGTASVGDSRHFVVVVMAVVRRECNAGCGQIPRLIDVTQGMGNRNLKMISIII